MIGRYKHHSPKIAAGAFVAETASVIGQVEIAADANIWYGAVLRGDVGRISIGERTNIQDLTLVHVTDQRFDTHVGNDVTVGHAAIIHGCRVENHVLVGMGSTILDGAVIEPYCIVGANALVPPGKRIASGSLVLGSPARVVRQLSDGERDAMASSAAHYVEIARGHSEAKLGRTF